jgi:integrase
MSKPQRLPSGRWRVRWVDHAGKRRSDTFATEASAKAGLRRREVERDDIRAGRVAPTIEAPTFRSFVNDRWMKTYPGSVGMRARTVGEYESTVRVHLEPAFGELRLDEITEEVISRFTASLAPRKPATVANIVGALGTILRAAHKWGALAKLPELPRVKVPEQEWTWITAEQSALVLEAAGESYCLAILFALHTGARYGEQRAIQWGDLDWQRRLVLIRRAHPHRGVEGPTKSGKAREVPMTDTLHRALKSYRGLRHLADGERVFPGLDVHQVGKALRRACRRAGVAEIHWHSLRHSFASQLVSAGVPLRQVQAWLGHATIAMTERYAHLAPGGNSAILALDGHVVATRAGAAATTSTPKAFPVRATGIEPVAPAV